MNAPLPRHAQLTQTLRDRITSGALKLGERLPPEVDLAADYNVSRTTLRRAMAELESEGLVERRRRLGTIVVSNQPQKSLRMATSGFPELLSLTKSSRLQVLKTRHVADGESPFLGTHQSSTGFWLEITAERFLGQSEKPVSWLVMFVDGAFAGIDPVLDRVGGSVFELIEGLFDLQITRLRQSVTALACPSQAAASIGLEAGMPVIALDAELYAEDGRLVEITHAIYDPNRFRLRTDVWMD
ncbi:GntR family transcriptional regulator [uncultured Nitratireductor sp.]|uniref:GntR family transcriptional regulator n=1 Tax=uncultured Nitratireductor sp. TaxID=520953 RepID=UPI00260D4A60|nr:GntR family transcriptional regulator [uncultured Nitratireductor sp.]